MIRAVILTCFGIRVEILVQLVFVYIFCQAIMSSKQPPRRLTAQQARDLVFQRLVEDNLEDSESEWSNNDDSLSEDSDASYSTKNNSENMVA